MRNVKELTIEELNQELLLADDIIKYCTEVKERALELAKQGTTFKGFVLKEVSGIRKFTDVEALCKLAEEYGIADDKLYETKLVSPAKLEKEYKNNKELIFKISQICDANPSYRLVKNKE